jgi:chromosome segregation ATPase
MSDEKEKAPECMNLAECKAEIERLHIEIDTIKQAQEETKQALSRKITAKDLQEDMSKLEKQIDELGGQVASMGASIKKLFAKNNEHNTSLETLSKDIKEMQGTIKAMSEGNLTLGLEIKRTNDNMENMQATQGELQKDIREVRGQTNKIFEHLLGEKAEAPVSVIVNPIGEAADEETEAAGQAPWWARIGERILKQNPALSVPLGLLVIAIIYTLIFRFEDLLAVMQLLKQ